MRFAYMIPSVSSLPSGYDCTLQPPIQRLGNYLAEGRGAVLQTISVYAEGECLYTREAEFHYQDGHLIGTPPDPFVWHRSRLPSGINGYLENSFHIADGAPLFLTNTVIAFYTIYNTPGKKSFFSDNAYLYASPPVISQIAKYGRYIDGYPVVRVDRNRDYGESIIFINPYQKPIKARIMTKDGREIPNIRIPPKSAHMTSLERLLTGDETSWAGQIQITATNRVITFDAKHSLEYPTVISDHEHLDPYRGEPTHFPAFRWFRLKVGRWASQRRYWRK